MKMASFDDESLLSLVCNDLTKQKRNLHVPSFNNFRLPGVFMNKKKTSVEFRIGRLRPDERENDTLLGFILLMSFCQCNIAPQIKPHERRAPKRFALPPTSHIRPPGCPEPGLHK